LPGKNDISEAQGMVRKIELWSNDKESHFAIRLDIDDHFRAKTNEAVPDEKFVKIVDQEDFLADSKYQWAFTLRHWIKHNLSTKDA
jgi:hypothetical protein